MDQRTTLSANEGFTSLLQHCSNRKESIRLLYDDNGLTRAEGFIKLFDADAKEPFIVLSDNTKVLVQTIVGVNGIFKNDYSEC